MMVGVGVLIIFVIAAWLMFRRILPAILALPLMAIAIAMIEVVAGKLTLNDIGVAIIADGGIRLVNPMVISMFGGMVSEIMQRAGVAESFVRKGAELAGDNPLMVSLITLGVIALLFTTIGGLGAVIMIGTIVLPILNSLGLKEYVCGAIILFGISLGGIINPNNWAFSTSVLGLDVDTVSSFSLQLFVAVAIGASAFVTFELWRAGTVKFKWSTLRKGVVTLVVITALFFGLKFLASKLPDGALMKGVNWVVIAIGSFAILSAIKDAFLSAIKGKHRVRWYSYLIPLVPLALILLFKVSFIPAFLCGFAYGILATYRKGSMNMTTRAVIEGSQNVIPAVVLMIGIGMLLSAILGPTKTGPGKAWHAKNIEAVTPQLEKSQVSKVPAKPKAWPVLTDMKPLMDYITPSSPWTYVLIFALLGPLALYRGPLNVWGLGYGVGGVLLLSGVPAGAVMGILSSLGIVQGVSDPTNTQNVWVANEVRVDVNTLMWRTLPYTWLIAIAGLIVASIRFY